MLTPDRYTLQAEKALFGGSGAIDCVPRFELFVLRAYTREVGDFGVGRAARRKARKLTPDRYTLQAEKALFGGSGAIDCEVLTLSRLCRRVCGADMPLSREGGVMLVAKAIAAVNGCQTRGNVLQ